MDKRDACPTGRMEAFLLPLGTYVWCFLHRSASSRSRRAAAEEGAPVLWPAFRKKDLYEAIIDYQGRERRFGKTSEQMKKV